MKKVLFFWILLLFLLCRAIGQVPNDGLLAYYPLDGNASDASGNGHHGTIQGVEPTFDRFGRADGAMFFSGSNWVEIPDTATLRPHNFTYSFWFTLINSTIAPTFIQKPRGSGIPASFGVWFRASSIQTYVTRPGEETYLKSPLWIPPINTWHHIAVTGNYTTREYQIWADGICFAQVALNVENSYDQQAWIIGASRDDNKMVTFLFGNLDDLRIYNRALNETEIHTLAADNPDGKPIGTAWMHPALPDGKYIVWGSEINGVQNNRPRKIELTGQGPLWQSPWFVTLAFISIFGASFFALRLRFNLKERLRRLELEKWKALEFERGRIARDLHDDLGSGISAISLLSQIAQQKSAGGPVDEEISQLSSASHELSVRVREIIWMVSARNDRLDYLISYLSNYVVEQFENSAIELNLHLPEKMPQTLVQGEQRRALFQALKEALHLVMTLTGSKQLWFSFQLNGLFELKIEWDGRAISTERSDQTASFKHLIKKFQECGGIFSMSDGPHPQWRLCLPV